MNNSLRLEISADAFPGPLRILVSGWLTRDNFPDLAEMLQRGVSSHSYPSLCVDLNNVDDCEPAALQALQLYISQHNAAGGAPKITVEPTPALPAGNGQRPSSAWASPASTGVADTFEVESDQVAPAPTLVADLMSPLGASIGMTQSLREAADTLTDAQEGLVVHNLSYEPVGFLPTEHLTSVMQAPDSTWEKKLCSSLMQTSQHRVRPEHAVEGIIQQYRHDGAQTMLVYNGDTAVGLLHPKTVDEWCWQQNISPERTQIEVAG